LQGFQKAQNDEAFARVSGSAFGGLNLQPQAVVAQIWSSIFAHLARGGAQAIGDLISGRGFRSSGLVGDIVAWESAWRCSLNDDPAWHYSWLADVARTLARALPTLLTTHNPRVRGPLDAMDGLPMRLDLGAPPRGPESMDERRSGALGTIMDFGANALGFLGNVLQDVSASQRSRGKMADGGNSGEPSAVFAEQAVRLLQAAYEANERVSHDQAPNPGAYRRRWRAKE